MSDDARRFDTLEKVVRDLRQQLDDTRALLANRIGTHTHSGGGAGVASVTAGDTTITIAGTGANPTVAVNAIAESKVTNLTTDLAAKLAAASNLSDVASAATSRTNLGVPPSTRLVSSGTGLTGGGDLSADRTLAVAYGNTSTTAAVGNDTRIIQGAVIGYPINAYGYVACSIHPDCVANVATGVSINTLEVYRLWVPAGQAITGAACYIGTAGVTPGSTNASGFALYSDAGVQITTTANDYTLFTTTGLRTKAFSSGVAAQTTDTWYRLGMVHTCSTAPKFAVGPGNASGFNNVAVSGTHRRGVFQTSVTAYPASFTPSTYGTLDSPMLWMALY